MILLLTKSPYTEAGGDSSAGILFFVLYDDPKLFIY